MNSSIPIAAVPPEVVPVFAVFFILLILPTLGILAWHQQRMAILVRQDAQSATDEVHEIEKMRQEIQELKAMIAGLAIGLDDHRQRALNYEESQERLSGRGTK